MLARATLTYAIVVAAVAAGCVEDAPTSPNFQTDVVPILAANCVRCHGVPTIGGAPSDCIDSPGGPRRCGFRLDSYDDTIIDEGDPTSATDDRLVLGLASVALAIPERIDSPTEPMPPRFPLGDRERAILAAWATGDPPVRSARPDNLPPTATAALTDGAMVAFAVDVADDDRDPVVGELRARGPAGDRLIAPLRSGRASVSWPRPTAAGRYEVVARLDDGAGWIEVPVASLEVAP
jgi:hypothetical protein